MCKKIAIFFLFVDLLAYFADAGSSIGICYGRVGNNVPAPANAVRLLQSNGIGKARLFLPDPAVLPAFSAGGIDLMIGVPNENLTYIAKGGPNAALSWLQSNIFAFVAPERVRYLAVGNEVLYMNQFYADDIMPAMQNLHTALKNLGLDSKIKLSSAHASNVLANSYPPSAGVFDPNMLVYLRPMLAFLAQTGAPFMVNTYPFISYVNDPVNIPLSYAMFGPDAVPVQDGSLAYTNLFDATVDAIVAAMEKEGFTNVPVAVTETGWPTAGHEAATPANAATFNGRLIGRIAAGAGTLRRPTVPVEVFLFDTYDEDLKPGQEFEKHFGIFKPDGSKAYDISFA